MKKSPIIFIIKIILPNGTKTGVGADTSHEVEYKSHIGNGSAIRT